MRKCKHEEIWHEDNYVWTIYRCVKCGRLHYVGKYIFKGKEKFEEREEK